MNHVGTQQIQTARLVLRRFRQEDSRAVWQNYGSDPAQDQRSNHTEGKDRI